MFSIPLSWNYHNKQLLFRRDKLTVPPADIINGTYYWSLYHACSHARGVSTSAVILQSNILGVLAPFWFPIKIHHLLLKDGKKSLYYKFWLCLLGPPQEDIYCLIAGPAPVQLCTPSLTQEQFRELFLATRQEALLRAPPLTPAFNVGDKFSAVSGECQA